MVPSNFDAAAVRPALERSSCSRLQTDYVDVYLLHNPPARKASDGSRSGSLRRTGAPESRGQAACAHTASPSIRSTSLKTVIKTTRCQAVEVLFNVFHQEPFAAFRQANARGIGLIAKVPLDSGWLSGKYRRHEQRSTASAAAGRAS